MQSNDYKYVVWYIFQKMHLESRSHNDSHFASFQSDNHVVDINGIIVRTYMIYIYIYIYIHERTYTLRYCLSNKRNHKSKAH